MSALPAAQRTFYGVQLKDWADEAWGGSSYKKILVDDYPTDWCSTVTSSAWVSTGSVFLYPLPISEHYTIFGIAEGEVAFFSQKASTARSCISDFRVSIIRVTEGAGEEIIGTTGVKSVASHSYRGQNDIGYHWWIDLTGDAYEMTEYDKLAVRVEWDVGNYSSTTTMYLLHDHDASYNDFWVKIPVLLSE